MIDSEALGKSLKPLPVCFHIYKMLCSDVCNQHSGSSSSSMCSTKIGLCCMKMLLNYIAEANLPFLVHALTPS